VTVGPALKVVVWWLFWNLPIAVPYEPPLPVWLTSHSIVRTATFHLGVWGASDAPNDAAVTIRITAAAISL